MGYTIEDLIEIYAEYNEMEIDEAYELYYDERISKYDLLEAYLHNEGIFGYTQQIWHIYNAF